MRVWTVPSKPSEPCDMTNCCSAASNGLLSVVSQLPCPSLWKPSRYLLWYAAMASPSQVAAPGAMGAHAQPQPL